MGQGMAGDNYAFALVGKTPEQAAEYIRNLPNTPNYDAKKVEPFLDAWEKNPNPEIAAAAKELRSKSK